ncbi:MAG: hypothetical protein IT348_01680 [Candidatus Eisenbacteria bacterium]|nr:hypothetical protein [Candidatus Eisenbacteria bacterium]
MRPFTTLRRAASAALLLAAIAGEGAAESRASTPYGSALPRFALFGWAGPPRELTTAARYAEYARAGLNVALLALNDPGTFAGNVTRLEVTRPLGLRNFLLDDDLDSVFIARPETYALADSIVSRYRDDPAFLGYYLGDEPPADYFPRLGEWFEMLRRRDPAHPAWNSLGPRGAFPSQAAFESYLRKYVEATHPAVLCNNQYDFQIPVDQHFLTENIAAMGEVAREEGIPFWGVVQLVEHFIFREVTEGMLRWEVAQWLAGGATGIGYFTYWTPPPNAEYDWQPAMIAWETGERTAYYAMVSALNARLAPLGNTLAGLHWTATQHAGSVPRGGTAFSPDHVLLAVGGRATIGRFTDSLGTPHVFVGNSDSVTTRAITLTVQSGRRVHRLRDDGGWDKLTISPDGHLLLVLQPGDFRLLRVLPGTATAGAEAEQASARVPLTSSPNPARGAIRFEVQGAPPGARLELFDLGGRRVWTSRVLAASRSVEWRGAGASGAPAPAGIYFARLSGSAGATPLRLVWLGAD